jgi:hypothetical protein
VRKLIIPSLALHRRAGWWTGECRGKYGLFPGAFVELLTGPEAAVAFAAPHDAHASANAPAATADAQNNNVEVEALPASASMASLDGADGEAGEVLSYLEEGLQENGSHNDAVRFTPPFLAKELERRWWADDVMTRSYLKCCSSTPVTR